VRKCVACQYFDRNESRAAQDSTQRWGQCRRGVPVLNPATAKGYVVEGVWPHVREDDWCGEWLASERSEPQVKHPLETLLQGSGPAVRAPLMTPVPSVRPASPFLAAAPSGSTGALPPAAVTITSGAAPGMNAISVD